MKSEAICRRRAFLALGALALAATGVRTEPASAGAVAPSLRRPALQVHGGEHAVLLAAAAAGRRLVAVGERGLVLISDDQGVSWRQSLAPTGVTLTAVCFADERHGVAAGHCGVVLVSADAGETWRIVLDGTRAAAVALEAARAAPGEAALRNAERLASEGADKPLLDVLAGGASDAITVGAYGLAFATADQGRHWTSWIERLDNPKALHCCAVRRRGDTIVVVGEQGLLRRSADAGRTFTRVETPYKGSFFVVELPAEHDIVVAGLRGNAWCSRDDGSTWTRIAAPGDASITASLLMPDGSVLLGNQQGAVLRLAGDRLDSIGPGVPPPINALACADGRNVIALTAMGARPLAAGTNRKG